MRKSATITLLVSVFFSSVFLLSLLSSGEVLACFTDFDEPERIYIACNQGICNEGFKRYQQVVRRWTIGTCASTYPAVRDATGQEIEEAKLFIQRRINIPHGVYEVSCPDYLRECYSSHETAAINKKIGGLRLHRVKEISLLYMTRPVVTVLLTAIILRVALLIRHIKPFFTKKTNSRK